MSPSTAPAELAEAREEPQAMPDAPPQREIVVGVNGGECALAAVRWAAREAERRGAPLRIVHAAPYLGRAGVDGSPSPDLPHARRITAKAFTVARHAAPGLRTVTEVVRDDPATALLKAGAGSQLIVLGIPTTGAVAELVLAPVAERVAARANCPVVVVPRRKGPSPAGGPVVAVLGLGSAEDDEAVAAVAAEAARDTGRPVSIIQTKAHAEDKRSERFPGLEVDREEIPHASGVKLLGEACPTPLLVLSAGHEGRLHRGLAGVHRWLLRHCTSPMALVPPADRTASATAAEDGARG